MAIRTTPGTSFVQQNLVASSAQTLLDAIVTQLTSIGWTNPTGGAGTAPRHVLCPATPTLSDGVTQNNQAGIILDVSGTTLLAALRDSTGAHYAATPYGAWYNCGAGVTADFIAGPTYCCLFKDGAVYDKTVGWMLFECLYVYTGYDMSAFLTCGNNTDNAAYRVLTECDPNLPACQTLTGINLWEYSSGYSGIRIITTLKHLTASSTAPAYSDGAVEIYGPQVCWGDTWNGTQYKRGEMFDAIMLDKSYSIDTEFTFNSMDWKVVCPTLPGFALRIG